MSSPPFEAACPERAMALAWGSEARPNVPTLNIDSLNERRSERAGIPSCARADSQREAVHAHCLNHGLGALRDYADNTRGELRLIDVNLPPYLSLALAHCGMFRPHIAAQDAASTQAPNGESSRTHRSNQYHTARGMRERFRMHLSKALYRHYLWRLVYDTQALRILYETPTKFPCKHL